MFVCAFGGPQGPVLMSYLCAFLTRAQCSAHGTVILDRGWPCWAARLCRLLYLWHHHQHHVHCFCVLIFASVCIPGAQECRGLTQEANTVYISIMNRERESERNRGRKREGGQYGESHFPSAVFIPSQQLTPVVTFSSVLHFYFLFLLFLRLLPLVSLCLASSDRLHWTKHSVTF